MVKIVVGLVVLVLVVWGISSRVSVTDPQTKPTIKIGVTLPLTGDVAMLGKSAKNALELSKSQLPPNTKYNYELVFEDDQFKPSLGATTAQKLISIDHVSALVSFGSPVGNVVSPIAQNAQIIHINDFASASSVANGDYNFVHYTPAYEDSKLFITELNKRGIKTLVFFGQQDNPGATALINAFEKDIVNTDIQVLSVQKFNTGTRDFRTQIEKVKSLNPEIYVLEATSPELELLTKQLREAGITTPVTTMEAFEFSDQLSLFEGMWYVNGADPMPWFVDLYTKTYNESPKFGAANAYDVVNLIAQSVEKVGDGKTIPTSAQIKQQLAETKGFNGAVGNNLSIDSDGLVISKPVVRMIKDGKPVTISQ
ncbi:MAG: ABC transporter substrate-binding protein [Patescibacteria group bacterium]